MVGRAGGILVAWEKSKIELVDQMAGEFSLTILVRSNEDNR